MKLIAFAFLALLPAFGQQAAPNGCSAITPITTKMGGANWNGFVGWDGTSEWTKDVSSMPVDPYSGKWIYSITGGAKTIALKGVFSPKESDVWGSVWYGHLSTVVTAGQPKVEFTYDAYGAQSDPGPWPIPIPPMISGTRGPGSKVDFTKAGDKTMVVIDKDNCLMYEMYNTRFDPASKQIKASAGSVWDLLGGDHQRPWYYTGGASVSGMPYFYGALRYDEVASGDIKHALAFTALYQWGRAGFTGMASHHQYSNKNNPDLPPFGARARLKANYDISKFSPFVQTILKALKKHGMIYIDGGHPIDLVAAADERWDYKDMASLYNVFFTPENFDFVEAGPIYSDPMYGGLRPPAGPKPVISSFQASAPTVAPGAEVKLSWSVSGVPSRVRFVTPEVGPVVGESVTVRPSKTTTYTLMVQNVNGRTTQNVTVTVAKSASCTLNKPAIAVSPAHPSMGSGESVNYLLSVTNTDSTTCAATAVNLAAAVPAGWTAILNPLSLTLGPGKSGAANVTVKAPASALAGVYTPSFTASSAGGNASTTASCTILPPATPTASIQLSTFRWPTRLEVRNTVNVNGKPLSGGTVTLTVTRPDGKVENLTRTAANGSAHFLYTPPVKGAYKLQSRVAYSGAVAVSNQLTVVW